MAQALLAANSRELSQIQKLRVADADFLQNFQRVGV